MSGLKDLDGSMALVGRYETYEQLGSGSTGTVYRARDTVLGREVALRILNQHARVSSRLVKSFSAASQVAPEWLHPNIAVIYDLGKSQVGEFVATELLAGAEMRSYIRDRCTLTLLQKLDLLAQAANGLAHAHRNGIVHGAIRPASFFIDERQHVRILDFGIRYQDLPEEVLDQHPALMDYCAPEQLQSGSCGSVSDVFSAALVFYEFLVCVHPFRDENIPNRILNDAPDSLLRHDPALPQSLELLFERALRRDPAERTQSMQELATGFRAVESQLLAHSAPRLALQQTQAPMPPPKELPLVAAGKPKILSFRLKLAGTAFCAVCVILAAYLVNLNKQIRRGKSVAQANVRAASANLYQSPDPRSRTLATLAAGTPIEILDHAPGAEDRFVKAQSAGQGEGKVGYLATVDLGDWRSKDPHAAWSLLLLQQPKSSSTQEEIRSYLAALSDYRERFPNVPEAGEAKTRLEQAREWVLPQTKPAQAAAATVSTSVPTLPASGATLPAFAPPEAPQNDAGRQAEKLVAQIPALWEEGNLETIVELTQKALILDPANAAAKLWRTRAQKALRKLNDQ